MSFKFINDDTFEIAQLSGIYMIANNITHNIYIGESLDIKRRRKEHYNALKTGQHYNLKMQHDYNLYGEESFEFKILQPHLSYNACRTKAELMIIENKYIKEYSKYFSLYNTEDTLDKVLINKNIILEKKYFTCMEIRNYIVSILTHNNVIFRENKVFITRAITLSDHVQEKRKTQKRIDRVKDVLRDYLDEYFYSGSIKYYNDARKEIDKRTFYFVKDVDLYYKFLEEHNYNRYIDNIKENLENKKYIL